MSKQAIIPADLPLPIGAYSPAIRAGNLLFISGQVALDAEQRVIGVGDMEVQAREVFRNVGLVLEAAGEGPEAITQLTIFLTDMSARAVVSQVRREFVREPYPASSLVGVSALAHPDLLIEVEATAVLGDLDG